MTRAAVAIAALVCASCTGRGKETPAEAPRARLDALPSAPFVLYVDVAHRDTFKRVSIAPLADPAGPAFVTDLVCERVYFSGGRGICLAEASASDAPVRVWADAFDGRFARGHRFPLTGVPSRVRISPDGRRAAATVFANGHSYAENGFSTLSTIFDLVSETVAVADLEQFAVTRDGAPFKNADFNFWGVTFARDGDTFYATLASGRHNYLIRGSVDARSAQAVHDGVECPSLSPDNTRIAFKKRIGGASGWWQVTILDLATMTEKALWNESRSVDDQVEWLDDGHVMYHLTGGTTAADIWTASIDGSTKPRILVAGAYSPAVVRDFSTTQVVMQR